MANASENNANVSEEYEPLDTMQMKVCSKNGIQTTVSAIHIGFMETRYYIQFKMLPILDNNNPGDTLTAEEEECLEYMMFLEEDFHWVLKLPHHRFWSQVVYDENLHRCLELYLSQAPRPHEIVNLKIKEELLNALKKIHKLVFLIYLRMSTYKESKRHHIRPEAFGNIIYDNYLFDIPKIMDLCALYGIQNSPIISKMISNIFSTQPKYKDDLDETVKVILTVFNNIEEKLLNISNKHGSNQNSSHNADIQKELSQYRDVINYIADVSFTIHVFLETYPPACQMFYQNGTVLRIPTFYEHVFTFIEKEVAGKMKSIKCESGYEDFKRKVSLSKTSFLRIFRNILNYTCIQNILDSKISSKNEDISRCPPAENFLDIIMESCINKNFLKEYNILYPFENDVELFNEMGINLDSLRINYVFCSIYDSDEALVQQFTSSTANGARPKTKMHSDSEYKPVKSLQGLADSLRQKDFADSNRISVEKEINKPTEIEMNSLIQCVQDTLQIGEGFIEKCLEFYSYDSEKVIDAILTESLPDHLRHVDRNLKRENKSGNYSVSSELKNAFQNDVFSSNDVAIENIHIGKKNKTPNTYDALENSSESELIKQRTLAYGAEETELELNLYEDEYDDTYDSSMVGLKEPPLEDEPDPSDNDQDLENPDERQLNNNDFCINPEILRERAEQRRQAKRGSGRNSRSGGNSADQSGGFQNKDRNKAYVGNHNRRKQADFKRSRGMGPFR